jgi:hypothetical protein
MVLTVVLGAVRYGVAGYARSLLLRSEMHDADLRAYIGSLSTEGDAARHRDTLERRMNAVFLPVDHAARAHTWLSAATVVAFTAGLSGLFVFATRNLPF